MSCQHDHTTFSVLTNHIPREATGVGIHARGRLIEKHYPRSADKRDGDGQLASLTSRQRLRSSARLLC